MRLAAAVPPSPSTDVETASTGSGGGQRDRRGSGATSRSSSPPTESEAERYDVDSESENAKASRKCRKWIYNKYWTKIISIHFHPDTAETPEAFRPRGGRHHGLHLHPHDSVCGRGLCAEQPGRATLGEGGSGRH